MFVVSSLVVFNGHRVRRSTGTKPTLSMLPIQLKQSVDIDDAEDRLSSNNILSGIEAESPLPTPSCLPMNNPLSAADDRLVPTDQTTH